MESVSRAPAPGTFAASRRFLPALVLAVAFSAGAGPASANHTSGRSIFVNGQMLNPYQVAQADHNAGYRVPNGFYWLNHNTGYWGAVGGPALGRIAPTDGGGGSSGAGGQGHYNTVIDTSGGCEGGSCVNIIDRW